MLEDRVPCQTQHMILQSIQQHLEYHAFWYLRRYFLPDSEYRGWDSSGRPWRHFVVLLQVPEIRFSFHSTYNLGNLILLGATRDPNLGRWPS